MKPTTSFLGEKLQKVILPEAEVCAVQAGWLKPCKWKSMVLSRDLKQKILSACGALSLWMEELEFLAPRAIEPYEAAKQKCC